MRIKEIRSLTEVMHQALYDIETKTIFDDNGNAMSNYYTLITGENGELHDLSVAITKDDGEGRHGGWYMVHVIDDINSFDCELRFTATQSENELLLELSETLYRSIALAVT